MPYRQLENNHFLPLGLVEFSTISYGEYVADGRKKYPGRGVNPEGAFVSAIENLPYYLSKNTTVVQMEKMIGGKPYWFNILTTKGGKWTSIDKNLLESLEVGDMHGSFPKMIDWNIWKAMNTKFHSCKSFVMNQAA